MENPPNSCRGAPSLSRLPEVWLFLDLSDPARSTTFSLERSCVRAPLFHILWISSKLKMQWERLEVASRPRLGPACFRLGTLHFDVFFTFFRSLSLCSAAFHLQTRRQKAFMDVDATALAFTPKSSQAFMFCQSSALWT